MIRPVIKWAGGKSKLLHEITSRFPDYVHKQEFCLIEPFVGGGAVSLWALEHLPYLKKLIINDYNADLIGVYQSIQQSPQALIDELSRLQLGYDNLVDLEDKKPFYYQKRDLFNERSQSRIMQSALFIFLNKAGFNGLYRVNKNNHFNVPIGSYKSPQFLDKDNILSLSQKLKNTDIFTGDFEQTLNYMPKNLPCLFYIDPPYRPISKTSNFTAYAEQDFNDDDQKRLARFCRHLNELNCHFILSNSDPKNHNIEDDFFEDLYHGFNIDRVQVNRAISAKSSGRKAINEVLIYNKK